MYGTAYDACRNSNPYYCDHKCGYNKNRFVLYTSNDMVTWTIRNKNLIPEFDKDSDHNSYWMPNVAYNRARKEWVMIYWDTKTMDKNLCNVNRAVSKNPEGPFTPTAPIYLHSCRGGGSTAGLWVDDDNTAYLRHDHHVGANTFIEKLTDDWSNGTDTWATVINSPVRPYLEGGGFFKNRQTGIYYVMAGSLCCFCSWGSTAEVFYAKSPLGPWKYQGNINQCADGRKIDWEKATDDATNPCSLDNPAGTNFTIPAQQFNSVEFSYNGGRNWTFLFYGERSQTGPGSVKSNQFQAWIPLEFESDGIRLKQMKWLDRFELEV
ncbi:hypothetical protein AKO1_005734 [Acrasis kona]|uniref:Uncharacterized protein n=1 Tax=Acrasis kona TaxID=1008807 RepID=A0AAW2YKN3_9EUKA